VITVKFLKKNYNCCAKTTIFSLVGVSISIHLQLYKRFFLCHFGPLALNGHIFLTSQPFALIQMVMDFQLGAL
jgi:hypothetical protein